LLTATTGFKQISTGFIDDHSRKPAIGKHPDIFEKHWYANPLKLLLNLKNLTVLNRIKVEE